MRLSNLVSGDICPDPDVMGITQHNLEVEPGYLFAALPGSKVSGVDYIDDAIGRGAVAVLAPCGTSINNSNVALVTDENVHLCLAKLAAMFYSPQPEAIVAVTGTNGKTSVASFTREIWSRLCIPAASVGTLGVQSPSLNRALPNTTPEPVLLHRVLADLSRAGTGHAVLEASSHGLSQYRVDGVNLMAAAFTNLSRDHLDYHTAPNSYLDAKLRLFEQVMAAGRTAVLNADVPEFPKLVEVCRARSHRVVSYGRKGMDIKLVSQEVGLGWQRLQIGCDEISQHVDIGLTGDFQASNVLCALGLVLACDGKLQPALDVLDGLSSVPGRMQEVARHPSGAPIFVDYAHTPDALERALESLEKCKRGKLVIVFGCGGERDAAKRPLMGEIAARLADVTIVTNDNPRGEDPDTIRREILDACPGADNIGDRAQAICTAIKLLEAGDVLLIAGKGHERRQLIADEAYAFDDSEVAREAIVQLKLKTLEQGS